MNKGDLLFQVCQQVGQLLYKVWRALGLLGLGLLAFTQENLETRTNLSSIKPTIQTEIAVLFMKRQR